MYLINGVIEGRDAAAVASTDAVTRAIPHSNLVEKRCLSRAKLNTGCVMDCLTVNQVVSTIKHGVYTSTIP